MSAFYRRTFLNRRGHHAGAYVLAQIDVRAKDRAIDAVLTLADCGRIIDLDFDVYDVRTLPNALHKARLLCDVVSAFTSALESAAEEL